MPFFNSMDWSDPNTMAMMGLISGLGKASAPSRLPVPFGVVMGDVAEGMAGGAKQGYENRESRSKTMGSNIGNLQSMDVVNLLRNALGKKPRSAKEIELGQYDESTTPSVDEKAPRVVDAQGQRPIAGMDSLTDTGSAEDRGDSQVQGQAEGPGSQISNMLIMKLLGVAPTEHSKAVMEAALLPPGPERDEALTNAAHAAGINVSPDLRQGGEATRWNPRKKNPDGSIGGYEVSLRNPNLPQGAVTEEGPDGTQTVKVLPGAESAISAAAGAQEAGKAPYELVTLHDAQNNEYQVPKSSLVGKPAAAPGPSVTPSRAAQLAPAPAAPVARPSNQPVLTPPPAATQPAGLVQRPTAPASSGQSPVGSSQLTLPTKLDDFMAAHPEAAPRQRQLPKGAIGFGKMNEASAKTQELEAERLSGYQAEASGGQKVYTNLDQLYKILNRGMSTGAITEVATDLANFAQQIGMGDLIPKKFDPNDAAAFQKLTTDLIFAQLKQLKGRPLVTEIVGLSKANPGLSMPVAANIEILNNALAYQRWADARSNLGSQYLQQFGQLAPFDSAFNAAYPEVDVYNTIAENAKKAGWHVPGDEDTPSGRPEAKSKLKFTPSDADIEYTAKKHGITTDQVRKDMGL